MQNRFIREEEIQRGVIARMIGMGIYGAVTITMVRDGEVFLNRPFVYTNEHFDSKIGLIGMESFSMSLKRATECLEIEEDLNSNPRTMIT